jgi:hypothetical protein
MTVSRSITFCSKHEGYTLYPKANQNGWLVVTAPNAAMLWEAIHSRFLDHTGTFLQYAFDYEGTEPDRPDLYPLGVLETIVITDPKEQPMKEMTGPEHYARAVEILENVDKLRDDPAASRPGGVQAIDQAIALANVHATLAAVAATAALLMDRTGPGWQEWNDVVKS